MMLEDLGAILYGLVLFGLSLYGAHRFWLVGQYLIQRHRSVVAKGTFASLPKVTVQLPIFNEKYVVERLLEAVAELDYPQNLLEIQLLDDSTDETQKIAEAKILELQKRGLDAVHIHRENRQGYKAGALGEGLRVAKGEFLAIFDADFLPSKDILLKTIHHFVDPEVGMIQTRWGHINRHYNFLTRMQALLLDGHLLIEQTVRNRTGRFFNFNGTAGVWRKTAIQEAGGWQHDTLTEDLDLSYRAQLKGWKFVFLPHLITPAELPVDMNSFKTQQHRWAKGAVQTCKKLLPTIWRSPVTLKIKMEATFHLTANIAYLLLVIMALLMRPGLSYFDQFLDGAIYLDLCVFVLATFSVLLFYGVVLWELKVSWWKKVLYLPSLMAIGIGLSINNAKAVMEALLNYTTGFSRTPKYGITNKDQTWKRKSYISSGSLLCLVEVAVALSYIYYVAFALQQQLWSSLPYFLFFMMGFSYVAFLSLWQKTQCYFHRS
ncbi:MAG: cellulose synthase family protein [Verrucomicrobiota bacterium]